jgi:translation initiation factor 5A
MSKPAEVGTLKIGHYVLIGDEPCRIVEYEKSKPGKHGAAKARIVAIGAFDNGKRSIVSPVDARVDVPIIEKKSAQVISLAGEAIQLMDLENYEVFNTTMTPEKEIKDKIAVGAEVEYWKFVDRTKIMRVKGGS